jgi:N-hydroxyarylamine O-acetyltransferase
VLDLDAYLERVGLSGRPSIAEVHRAHATSIPFENLDPHRGVAVSLEPADLERKLVGERRGGYCFEQNLLLKAALEALGAEVELLLARVRFGALPGTVRPRTHLVLRVHAEGTSWHADVGFGRGTLLEPLPFGPGAEHEQAGWRFRVVEEEAELVLQTATAAEAWADVYAFSPQPVAPVDVELSNWFTCSHPSSQFVTGLIVVAQDPAGTRRILSDWSELAFTEETPSERRVSAITREQIPRLLESAFDLPGFALGADGRIVRANE